MTLLALTGVTVGLPGQAAILSDLNFSLDRGARVGVVGPNGSGKTSLFHTIAGILAAQGGTVRLSGQPVRSGQFLPEVALVFQQADDQLFCPTLLEDVAFGARNLGLPADEVERRVVAALRDCGLTGLEDRPVYQLSGGEKRRACIAGALVMQPRLMLLDEPSAALDLRSRRRLITLLEGMDQAMLIASHDLELLLDLCARVIVLDGGRICAEGSARDVLGNAALMAAHGQEVPHSLTPHGTVRHDHRL